MAAFSSSRIVVPGGGGGRERNHQKIVHLTAVCYGTATGQCSSGKVLQWSGHIFNLEY